MMRAMRFEAPHAPPRLVRLARPEPGPEQVLIKVGARGVCRTDLHLVDGELPDPKIPVIPGHEIVGTVTAAGATARNSSPWPRRSRSEPR